MKKNLGTIVVAIIVLLVVFLLSIPFINNYLASRIATEIEQIPLPEKTTYIESVSRADKMVGNGNGIQYLGAVLIKSDLSIEELNEFYAEYNDLKIEEQTNEKIEFIDHGELSFEHDFDENENYYILYSWGEGIELFSALDMRGH